MPDKYDVIVIGAGNGGLMTAAFCAKNGLRTLVVEKHNIPGGSATSFVRGRFEFETSLHELASVGTAENPGGIMQLFQMLGADVEWCTGMDETFRLIVPEEGIDADMPCGVENFIKKMAELVPESVPSVVEMFRLGKISAEAVAFMDTPEFTEEALNEKYPEFAVLAGHSIKEVLDSIGMPEKAQRIVSTYWSYLGAPVDTLEFVLYARMLLGYIVYGAGMPRYFSHEISMALEKVIRDNGGEIWYNTEADKIIVKDGAAVGIEVAGKEYFASHVASNAYPDFVYGRMIDADQVPERAVKLVNSRKLGLSFVTVYLGMNKTMEELGITTYSNFIARTSDSVEQKRNATDNMQYPDYVIMNCLNKLIPDCTPEGTCQLFFTIPYFGDSHWYDLTPAEYFKFKDETAIKAIKHVEEAMGLTIMPYIEEIVVAAPPTFARYLNTPGGTPYGYQVQKFDRFIQRQFTLKEETFFDNLYFVGASSQRGDGYSTAYLSGIDAGKAILMAERQKGGLER